MLPQNRAAIFQSVSVQVAGAYLEPYKMSKMDFLGAKIVSVFQSLAIFAKS